MLKLILNSDSWDFVGLLDDVKVTIKIENINLSDMLKSSNLILFGKKMFQIHMQRDKLICCNVQNIVLYIPIDI